MSADEGHPATLDAVAEELTERAARMGARSPEVYSLSNEEAALQLVTALIVELKARRPAVLFPTEYYAHRVLHLVRWSGSNIGGGVMIEYLIHHGGDELELYFDRLLVETGYTADTDLPDEMRAAIWRMREEGRDPAEAIETTDKQAPEPWQPSAEQILLMDKLDSRGWPDMVTLIMEMEARHPELRDREMLVEELTAKFVQALKKNNLSMPHSREWYREHIATLVYHYVHPLFAGVVSCLLLNSLEHRSSETPRRRASIVFAASGGKRDALPRYNS